MIKMDVIQSALKCVNCRELLSQPITLPCGHTICLRHTSAETPRDSKKTTIMCLKCKTSHPNRGFVVSEIISDMIRVQLSSLDFGGIHRESSQACDDVRRQLDTRDAILANFDWFVHQSVSDLKNKVLLKSELLKLRIDEIAEHLLNDLDKHESAINQQYKSGGGELGNQVDELKRETDFARNRFWQWTSDLNALKVDEAKWTRIRDECLTVSADLRDNLKLFEQQTVHRPASASSPFRRVELFEKANLDHILKVDPS